MQEFTIDPKKLLYSRLWCWGTLVVVLTSFAAVNVFPLPDDVSLLYYLIAFMVVLQPLNVYLAERDYPKHRFRFDGESVTRDGQSVRVDELDSLAWHGSIFPETDSGGCTFIAGDSEIVVGLRYLADVDALAFIKQVRANVPPEVQKHWPAFCHSIALRLYFSIDHLGRDLPEPSEEESLGLKRAEKRQAGLIWCGLAVAVACGALLCGLGLGMGHVIGWPIGVYAVVFILGSLMAAKSEPRPMRNYVESQRIWESEVMNPDGHWQRIKGG